MINLSAPFSYEAIPLINALKSRSHVHFEWGEWENVKNNFVEKRIDGMLCPPLEALYFSGSFVVPAVGIASYGGVPSPILYSSCTIENLREVNIRPKFVYWKKWLEVLFRALDISPIKVEICDEYVVQEGIGYLLDVMEMRNDIKLPFYYNLGDLWKRIGNYPFVCWVWLCHGDSDYRQVRSILGSVWGEAKEKLRMYQEGVSIGDELLDAQRKNIFSMKDIYYNLASLEFEGIRWFVEQASKFNVIPEGAEIHLC